MLATKNTLDRIRKDIEKHLGKKILLRANKGRKKIVVKEGVIENTYPSIFIVKIDDEYNNTTRVSYSYSDVLTSTVKLEIGIDGELAGMPS
ncbi:Uncharacterized protein Veg [Peptoclostridium litorale DSM 5388]|uniref:Veg n=1 Tax=Peptoclostridium litorale DSM 5388 TaxID=1121324 RepID=A0A069RD00_PEPLI|nr:Veg [Peptoclostridium litorale DSM 5388]SIN95474.1 Uncharacterized protein Veg [Peptoclostridium litorale DSM 5388]